jgi:hypothetical protein
VCSVILQGKKMFIQNNYHPKINQQIIDKSHFVRKKNIASSMLKAWIVGNMLGLGVISIIYKDDFKANQKFIETKDIEWKPTIKVLASTGQNTLGQSNEKISYNLSLADKVIANSKIKTIEQANDSLAKQGYNLKLIPLKKIIKSITTFGYIPFAIYSNNKKYFSLETAGKKLNIFNKDEKKKNRFVLSLYDNREKRFLEISENFSEKIKGIYNIPNQNIINLSIDSLADFKHGVDSVMSKINQLKDKKNAELLILYNGHGCAVALNEGDKKVEGRMEGMIVNEGITETQVKEILNGSLKNIKTLIIMDTCHSGAWIASNAKKALQTFA